MKYLPLVCLHKLGGWGAEFDALAALLDRPVIAPDLPGHGLGAHGSPPAVQRVEDSADTLIAGLPERFGLAGTSLGGAVAVRIAALLGERVRSLALISVALTGASDPGEMAATDALTGPGLYDDADRPLARSAADMERLFGVTDPVVQADLEASRQAAGRWIRPSWRGVSLADLLGWLPAVRAPVRLVYGERGGYRQFEAAGRAVLRECSVEVIADCGAFPHQERPGEVARLLDVSRE